MNSDRSSLWWSEIAGPSSIVQLIAQTLLSAKSVLLHVPQDLPWRRKMRDTVETALRRENDCLQVSYVDCQSDCTNFLNSNGDIDVANFLIQRFGLSDSYNGYRQSSGLSIQSYIINNDILCNRIVWVKGMNKRQVKNWVNFCLQYNSTRIDKGLFVIESYQDISLSPLPNIMSIKYTASYYDALLFNNMAVSSKELSVEWKQYIATLSAQLCQEDVELSVAFMNTNDLSKSEPVECLTAIAMSSAFENRYAADNLRSTHPFFLIRTNNIVPLEKKVWESQLRTLYPLIEMERVSFIRANEDNVRKGLDKEYIDYYTFKRHHIRQFGERVQDPYEAELGTLYSMNHLRDADNQYSYMLHIPSEEVRNRLALLHDMRNAIAHMNACSVSQVTEFLDNYPYAW